MLLVFRKYLFWLEYYFYVVGGDEKNDYLFGKFLIIIYCLGLFFVCNELVDGLVCDFLKNWMKYYLIVSLGNGYCLNVS